MMPAIVSVIAALAMSFPAHAATSVFDEYMASATAYGEFVAKSKGAELPRLNDKEGAKIIADLTNYPHLLDSQTFTPVDIADVLSMCDMANKLSSTYIRFHLNETLANYYVKPGVTEADQTAFAINMLKANGILFQDETTRLSSFGLRCLAKQAPVLTTFVESLPKEEVTQVRLDGVVQMRSGLVIVYKSLLDIMFNPQMKKENIDYLLNTITVVTPTYSQILNLDLRQIVYGLLLTKKPAVDPAYRAQYEQILTLMSSTTCTGLCKL